MVVARGVEPPTFRFSSDPPLDVSLTVMLVLNDFRAEHRQSPDG